MPANWFLQPILTHPRGLWGTGLPASSSDLENTIYKANLYIGSPSFPISLFQPTFALLLPGTSSNQTTIIQLLPQALFWRESKLRWAMLLGIQTGRYYIAENTHISEYLLQAKPFT